MSKPANHLPVLRYSRFVQPNSQSPTWKVTIVDVAMYGLAKVFPVMGRQLVLCAATEPGKNGKTCRHGR
jgi:hypothetical protein